MSTYTIKKGNHYCNFSHKKLWIGYGVKKLNFTLRFKTDPYYDFRGVDDMDINKLYGISFGPHHTNSFRLGWNYSETNKVCLWAYYYNKGERKYWRIGEVWPDVKYECYLVFDRQMKEVYVKIVTPKATGHFLACLLNFDFTGVSKWSYKLFPYFGGNNTAPKEFKIEIKDL